MAEPRIVVRAGSRLCVACERDGTGCRYGVDRLAFDDEIRAMAVHLEAPAGHEGGPGVAHGGWVAAVMDELLGQLATEYAGKLVTATLSISFAKPVPVGEPLIGRSRITSQAGRKVRAKGDILLPAGEVVLASAEALFITIDPDHHRRHAEWLAAQKDSAA